MQKHQIYRNQLLNILEAMAAFLVIFIHFPFPNTVGAIIKAIARLSVPFFFCISGYFFFKGDDLLEQKSIFTKIKKLLKLLMISEITYFTFYLILQIQKTGFSMQSVINLIEGEVFNYYFKHLAERLPVFSPIFNGTAWFITSLATVYGLMYIFNKLSIKKQVISISPFLLIGGLVFRRVLVYYNVVTAIPYERILPLLPLPFFIMGYHIHMNKPKYDNVKNKIYVFAIIIGLISVVIESIYNATHTLYIGTCIIVFSLICFASKNDKYEPKLIFNKVLSRIGERHSTIIYIMHMIVGNIILVFSQKFFVEFSQSIVYEWAFPFIVVICTTIFSVVIKTLWSLILNIVATKAKSFHV